MINHPDIIVINRLNDLDYGSIPIVTTEGKTYTLPEQIVKCDSAIKITKIKPGKIIVPRIHIKVISKLEFHKSKGIGTLALDIEKLYEEIQANFTLIEHNIFERFMELLPNGKGVYYTFSTRTDPTGEYEWCSINEIAVIWAEKIRKTG